MIGDKSYKKNFSDLNKNVLQLCDEKFREDQQNEEQFHPRKEIINKTIKEYIEIFGLDKTSNT